MNLHRLRSLLPRASASVLALNTTVDDMLPREVVAAAGRSHAPQPAGKLRLGRQPNAAEAAFGLILEARKRAGEFISVEFEAVKLKVGDGSFYCPDYVCEPGFREHEVAQQAVKGTLDLRLVFFEVKGGGPIQDDSIAKFKAARERYSNWARFEMWRKISGEWVKLA